MWGWGMCGSDDFKIQGPFLGPRPSTALGICEELAIHADLSTTRVSRCIFLLPRQCHLPLWPPTQSLPLDHRARPPPVFWAPHLS